jgi:sRNA-binding carbon storage regulator CsrA
MLALGREVGQSIIIDLRPVDFDALSDADKIIELQVLEIRGDENPKVRIGCHAAKAIPVHRKEIVADIEIRGRVHEPRSLASAAPQMLAACKSVRDAHDKEAQAANFQQCGCYICRTLQAAIDRAEAI